MKVYTLIVGEDPPNGWDASCRVEILGISIGSNPSCEARGIGSGPDPSEAAADAIAAAELGLPPYEQQLLRHRRRTHHHD